MPRTTPPKVLAFMASVVTVVVFAVATVALFTQTRANYTWALFLGVPFAMGMFSAAWAHRFGCASFGDVAWVTGLSLLATSAGLLTVGVEGLACIVMAAPLAIPPAFLGAFLTHLSLKHARARRGGVIVSALVLAPAMTFLPAAAPTLPVESHLEIAAPPQVVWKNVIQFPDLPEPTEWFFRAGLAYPKRARIDGRGPGAIRYCEFSTGPFVEPIRIWDEPHLLRFSVTSNPEPMREISPYNIHPAHLNGYFNSRQGQFLLTPLPGGRTLLSGTTWYQQKLWPQMYWRTWSDSIVHRIHLRVLNHIKDLSEAEERDVERSSIRH